MHDSTNFGHDAVFALASGASFYLSLWIFRIAKPRTMRRGDKLDSGVTIVSVSVSDGQSPSYLVYVTLRVVVGFLNLFCQAV